MPDEIQELNEHAEEGHANPILAPVSVTMAILAIFVATVSLLGHRAHTEELLLQTRATSQWAFFQAKNIRRHADDSLLDLLSIVDTKNAEQAAKIREKYSQGVERYKDEQKEIEAEAKRAEQEQESVSRRADRYDLGEVFLEMSLVITSITLLTRRRQFWMIGIAVGVVGLGIAGSGFLVH
jgi:hypothetical protein